jgi:hypothetical protein
MLRLTSNIHVNAEPLITVFKSTKKLGKSSTKSNLYFILPQPKTPSAFLQRLLLLLDPLALRTNPSHSHHTRSVKARIAVSAFGNSIVERVDRFVVAAKLADETLPTANDAVHYVLLENCGKALERIAQARILDSHQVVNAVEVRALHQVPSTSRGIAD